jgi:ABC-2 type transport system permease protein
MRKTLVIAVREYKAAVRTKTFVASLVLMPIMGSAGIIAAVLFKDQTNVSDTTYAIIDSTGQLFDDLQTAANDYNTNDIFTNPADPMTQSKPRIILRRVTPTDDNHDPLRGALSQRVRNAELSGFLEIDPRIVQDPIHENTHEPAPAVTLHTNNPMARDFQSWLHTNLNRIVRQERIARAGLDQQSVDWATHKISIQEQPLFTVNALGQVQPGKDHEHYVSIAAGVGLSLLMFLVILVGAIPLTYSVLEEKMQRSAEVLLGSVTAFQFMMGKVLGMVGVSLSIVTIYIVVGFAVASAYGYGQTVPHHLINWFILYQAGAILMFGSLYAAIGAACNDMKDAQNLMAPASLIACIPLFLIRPVMLQPNSTFSTIASFFPPATPVLMLMRQGMPTHTPLWQPILGLIIVLLSAILCVWFAARIFSVGILMQGKGANLKELMQWAVYGAGHRAARTERRTPPAQPSAH